MNQEEIDRIVKDALAKKSANNEENPPDDDPPKVTVLQQALLRRGVPSSSATTRPVPKPIPFPGGGDIFGRNRTTASANPAPVAIPPPKPVEAIPDTMLPPEVTDLNVLLTTRPDGEQALPGAIVQRWIRALVNAGITSPKQLENMTFDNLKYTSGIGENVAMKVSTAMMLWGSSLAPEPRVRMQELRAMAARNLSMPSDVNARDRRWLKAASISWNDIRKMTDYDVIDFSKRLESAKRAESMVAA